MRIGVGLPSGVTGVTRDDVLAWATRAEELGFSALAATDRIAWDDYEPLVTLAAAAAVTERVELLTNILVIPQRGSVGVLAKQLATLESFSQGRLTVGCGIGDREDDYLFAGQQFKGRFKRADEMLAELRAIWTATDGLQAKMGPKLDAGRPSLLLGGRTESALDRVVALGDGWTMALGTPERYTSSMEHIRAGWAQAGRSGEPRGVASFYFAMGGDSKQIARDYILDYFSFVGPYAEQVAEFTPAGDVEVKGTVDAFGAAGVDDLIFLPTSTDIAQLEMLAEAVL